MQKSLLEAAICDNISIWIKRYRVAVDEPRKEMNMKKGITGSTLKMIAIVTMLIDHIGAVLIERNLLYAPDSSIAQMAQQPWFEVDMVLRLIGRIAFPIFAFLLVEGITHTRDVKKYLFRLLIFGFVSEIPFDLAIFGRPVNMGYQNVFFTLFAAGVVLYFLEKYEGFTPQRRFLQLGIVILGMGAATLLKTDYSWIGVLLVVILYVFRNNYVRRNVFGSLCVAFELTAPLAFVPIHYYNGERGWSMKYFFYCFYPGHLLILYLIGIFLL